MKTLRLIALAALAFASVVPAFARCDNPDDRAADGSRCGGRSSTSRPGGR